MTRRAAVILAAGLLVAWMAGRAVTLQSQAPLAGPHAALIRLGPYQPHMTLRQAFESLPAAADRTALTWIHDNPDAWIARWRMLAAARESLDISYFIVREDLFGAAFLGHLLQKAEEGVAIRLLFDAQGTAMSFTSPRGNDWLDTLANAGKARVKLFRPLPYRYLRGLFTLNPVAFVASEHDKILVADRRVGMIGGRNISAEYFADPADMPEAFEDVDVVLAGPSAARWLVAAFEAQYRRNDAYPIEREQLNLASYREELLLAYRAMDAWLKGISLGPNDMQRLQALRLPWWTDLTRYPRLHGTLRRALAPDARAETRLLDSHTRLERGSDVIGQALERLTRSARKRILVQSPYLVLSKETVDVFAAAGARGVEIAVLTNSPISSDNTLSQVFFLEQWPELLARVPHLRIFVTGQSRTMHSKLAIFDDQVTVVGTYNLDPVSMQINSEIMAAVWSETFAQAAARHPYALLEQGAPLVYEYRIQRDPAGRPVRDADGRLIIAFGPRDHADPNEWRKIQVVWALLRAAEKVAGFLPIF